MTEITLSARDVRRLAEALDGVRGETFQVVLRDGKLHRLAGVETPLASDRKLFSVFTKREAPSRPSLTSVLVKPKVRRPNSDELIDEVVHIFDALFWSEAAVEKFVLPYYLRFYSAEEVNELWLAFLGKRSVMRPSAPLKKVLAYGHLPYSEPETLVEAGFLRDDMTLLSEAVDESGTRTGELIVETAGQFLTALLR